MGLNTYLALTVPAFNGDGPVLDVSALSAPKSIYLSGEFEGTYSVLGSHDGAEFVPIVTFTGGEGPQTLRHDVVATLRSMRVARNANRKVSIAVAGQAVAPCS